MTVFCHVSGSVADADRSAKLEHVRRRPKSSPPTFDAFEAQEGLQARMHGSPSFGRTVDEHFAQPTDH